MSEYFSEPLFTIGENEACLTAVRDLAKEQPNIILFRRPVNLEWIDVTPGQFLEDVYSVAKGLVANGVQPGDRVVIMSETRYEWVVLDYAIAAAGGIVVPIYASSSTSQCEWIVQDSGAQIAIGEGTSHTTRLETFLHDEDPGEGVAHLRRVFGINAGGIETLVQDGKDAGITQEEIEHRIAGIRSADCASIVYTSGTTGKPKGCRLTHANWLAEARGILTHPIGARVEPGIMKLTFLPLAHVFSRAVANAFLIGGATQAHWGDLSTLVAQFGRHKPHVIVSVPRVFEKVYNGAKAKAVDGGGPKAKIFLHAEDVARRYSRALDTEQGPSLSLKIQRAICDKLVYSKVREAMGGRLEVAISGGSALNPDLAHFFRGIGVSIYEGYGLTESTAALGVNAEPDNIIGTIGRPLPGNGAKVAEDGELLLKGSVIFDGYWNNEEATKEAFTEDGWYKTGDLGAVLPSGHVKITGRKKEIIVTAGGKNVSPGPLEDILRSSPLISQAMVVGNDQKFVGCLITLDEDALKVWKEKNNVSSHASIPEVAKNPVLRSEIQDAITQANATVSHAEGIKKFRIVARDFSEERNEMTPSLKMRRFNIEKNFADDIAWIYSEK